MAKDPAVLFYTQDFLVGTITMNYEQKGKYITLLCLQHQKGKLSDNDMKSILTEEDFEVAEKFIKETDGYWYNLRLKDEAEKRKNYAESRRNNRLKKIHQSYVKRMENENEDENADAVATDNAFDNAIDNAVINNSYIAAKRMKIKPTEEQLDELDKLI